MLAHDAAIPATVEQAPQDEEGSLDWRRYDDRYDGRCETHVPVDVVGAHAPRPVVPRGGSLHLRAATRLRRGVCPGDRVLGAVPGLRGHRACISAASDDAALVGAAARGPRWRRVRDRGARLLPDARSHLRGRVGRVVAAGDRHPGDLRRAATAATEYGL